MDALAKLRKGLVFGGQTLDPLVPRTPSNPAVSAEEQPGGTIDVAILMFPLISFLCPPIVLPCRWESDSTVLLFSCFLC